MNVCFRADASLTIGSGHVMRCLTLADALRMQGIQSHFICREHPGNLTGLIQQRGYPVFALPQGTTNDSEAAQSSGLAHAGWLGCSMQADAAQTSPILERIRPDWLIVDHYGLDARWQDRLRALYGRLLVIDDLADRQHRCDILLDQNLGRSAADYAALVPPTSKILAGPSYALLRPEFANYRKESLEHRRKGTLDHILINMGGIDQPDYTSWAMSLLDQCNLPDHCQLEIIMGATAPWREHVEEVARHMEHDCTVRVNIADMAQTLAKTDLVIGAAGSSSWERCCLGVPSLMMVLADNQRLIAQSLMKQGAAVQIGDKDDESSAIILKKQLEILRSSPDILIEMSRKAAQVADGQGTSRVSHFLLDVTE